MKLHTKLLIASFLPVVFFICMAGGISYFLTQRALVERSMHWLETRLSEAIQVTKKNEDILHKYNLQNIPASITKAKLNTLAELSTEVIGRDGYIFIADHQGVIVSHPDKYYVGTDAGKAPWFKQLSDKKEHAGFSIKNKKYLVAHDFFIPWNWHIFVVEPEKSTFQPIQKIKFILFCLTICAFIILFCFIFFFTKRLTRPLEMINLAVQQIKDDKSDTPILTTSTDEFADIARSFNRMAEHFQNKINQLHKDHAYYNTLCHNTTDLFTITDHSGQFIFVSPSAKRIIGYSPDELLGKKASDFIHPQEHDQLREHFRLGTLSDVVSPPTEFRFKHKTEMWCTLESISKNLLSHPDVKGFVTTSRNINRQKSEQNALKKSVQELDQQLRGKEKEMDQLRQRLADLTDTQKTEDNS